MHKASAAYISRILYYLRYRTAIRSRPPFAVCVCVCVCVMNITSSFYKSGAKVQKIFELCKFICNLSGEKKKKRASARYLFGKCIEGNEAIAFGIMGDRTGFSIYLSFYLRPLE